jgi:Transposase DDE domain group 1
VVSHAGSALLARVADKVGLTRALSRELGDLKSRRSGHDLGHVVRDLAVMLADGGDCLADLGALADQRALFGSVASSSTAFRVIDRIASDARGLERLRAARARARSHAWKLAGAPAEIDIDLDATLITSHSDKEGAAGNFKGGFGFHPLLAYGDQTGEALAGMLRPGNAGANTAVDQIAVAEAALEQIPAEHIEDIEILLRVDSAGASHELLDWCRDGRVRYSVGYDLTETVRAAILQIPDEDWVCAIDQDGSPRPNGHVVEITDQLDLSGWPGGSRVIVRRERAHPGAQLSFTDHDGHRFQAILTDQRGGPQEPAVPRLRAQPSVAAAGAHRPRPDLLDPTAAALRRARRRRAQAAALPATARRRSHRLPRPPRPATPAGHLALGHRTRRRLRAPQRARTTSALTAQRLPTTTPRSHWPPAALPDALSDRDSRLNVPAGTPAGPQRPTAAMPLTQIAAPRPRRHSARASCTIRASASRAPWSPGARSASSQPASRESWRGGSRRTAGSICTPCSSSSTVAVRRSWRPASSRHWTSRGRRVLVPRARHRLARRVRRADLLHHHLLSTARRRARRAA